MEKKRARDQERSWGSWVKAGSEQVVLRLWPWQLPRQWPREPISARRVQILHPALAAQGACTQGCAHWAQENVFPGARVLQLCCNEARVCATMRQAKQRVNSATQSSHFVDRAGWQTKMACIQFGCHVVMRTAPIAWAGNNLVIWWIKMTTGVLGWENLWAFHYDQRDCQSFMSPLRLTLQRLEEPFLYRMLEVVVAVTEMRETDDSLLITAALQKFSNRFRIDHPRNSAQPERSFPKDIGQTTHWVSSATAVLCNWCVIVRPTIAWQWTIS